MGGLLFLLGFLIIIAVATLSHGESSTCLTVYKEGGAPAVFQSPKCPRWTHSDYASYSRSTSRCQTAMLQGHRKSLEDRTLCALDLRIPFPGKAGVKEVTVGIVAVFDGHNGAEASEMASKLLLEYFVLHTYFLIDASYSAILKKGSGSLQTSADHHSIFQRYNWDGLLDRHELDLGRFKHSFQTNFDDSFHFEILKEALLRAIHDIDAKFSMEASRKNLVSGSTATIILLADGQILVANIGDSKALLCSEKFQSPAEAKATYLRLYRQERRNGAISRLRNYKNLDLASSTGVVHFSVKELTRDHHPDRDDEKLRVETAGGYVLEWGGVPRVNGELAISRAIGDVSFKSYGVISAPELTDWQPLTVNDTYLVAASDGVFEKLNVQDVCDLLWEVRSYDSGRSDLSSSCSYSLADCIVNTAFEKGSMDNVAAVVVPLVSTGFSESLLKERSVGEGDIKYTASGLQSTHEGSANDFSYAIKQLEYAHPVVSKFDRLLVQGKHGYIGCFILSENLDEHAEYMLQAKDEHEGYVYDLRQALPEAVGQQFGGPLNLYHDQNFCLHLGITVDAKDQCLNPEGFASFLALLESIPFHDAGSNNGSFEHSMPDRSGLREKYFGEIFMNASNRLGGSLSAGISTSVLNESQFDFYGLVETTDPTAYATGNSWTSENLFEEKFHGGFYEEGLNHIARYVESFESQANEIWLVFRYEGVSLSKLMYTVEEETNADEERAENVNHVQMLRPSKWWHWLKTTKVGQEQMRSLIWQLLMALKSCHDRNITHRDIKPENMVLCFEEEDTGRCLKGIPNGENFTTKMRIIDFGSATDEFTLKHLYGSTGPSRYDMWSVGVVMLELILGSPNVFQISSHTRILLDRHIKGWNEGLKELAYKLRSFMELCILIPGSFLRHHRTTSQAGASPASWKCSEEFFSHQIKSRDPLKLGFPNVWALRLVRQLLLWDPEERLSVDDALQHPYFQPPPRE
ncbi:Protein phosphatase 2C family protein [Prunus dulcis]|uniref:Protein phosphatase 2C family protein n=1 Tax=Prunus dulcis TaxID=3755 RepID=A0A4Y1S2R9_PRUDU|nr:Protein phosphatase 2C family protein [Prunus dulcis]